MKSLLNIAIAAGMTWLIVWLIDKPVATLADQISIGIYFFVLLVWYDLRDMRK